MAVIAMEFSFSGKYLISLGCEDDGRVVVWSAAHREPLCGSLAQSLSIGPMLCLAVSNVDDDIFVTAGACYGRIWKMNPDTKQLTHKELEFGSVKRVVTAIEICDGDNKDMPLIVCGTKSGEIMTFFLTTGIMQCVVRTTYSVTALSYIKLNDLHTLDVVFGTGDGRLHHNSLRIGRGRDGKYRGKLSASGNGPDPWRHSSDTSAFTAIAKVRTGESVYAATDGGHMYHFNLLVWHEDLVQTCPTSPIKALVFARDTDELIIVGEYEKVRIINTSIYREVRRYVRVNRLCTSLAVNHDGTCIFSGWDCGFIIVLGFSSKNIELKELYRMGNIQTQMITCLALNAMSDTLISGGKDGQSRVWRLADDVDTSGKRLRHGLLVHLLTGQSGTIISLKIAKSQQTFAAACDDATVVIYDIPSGKRLHIFKLDFGCTGVCFFNDDLHLITSCLGGRIYFFEIMTGECLRSIRGCTLGGINGLDTSKCSKFGVTVGDDELIRFWRLDTGEITHIGQGNGDVMTKVKYGPRGTIVASVANNGSLCIWRNPNSCSV